MHPKEQRKAPQVNSIDFIFNNKNSNQNPNVAPTALFTSLQPTPNFTSLFSVDTEVEDISVEQSEMEDKVKFGKYNAE